jgi:hypothetical protein
MVNIPKKITLKELKDESIFKRQSTVVTIQCSGTRRIEQIHEYPGDGDELINAPVSKLQNKAKQNILAHNKHSGVKAQSEPQDGPEYH